MGVPVHHLCTMYYEDAMDLLECESLNERRDSLCKKFAKKSARHPKFKNWFCFPSNISTRGSENRTITKFNPVQTRTYRYAKSPLPYVTEVMNNTFGKKT